MPLRRRIVLVMKVLGVALLAVVVFAGAASGSGNPARSQSTKGPTGGAGATLTSSRLVKDGHIRITAAVKAHVPAGKFLSVSITFTNISKQPRKIQLADNEYVVVHTSNGTKIDSRIAFPYGIGGPVPPTKLKPGKSVTVYADLRVLWSGRFAVTPGWWVFPLATLHSRVTTPAGPAPSDDAAIADVVASTGHMLDNCLPTTRGVAMTGRIKAPNVRAALPASCLILLRHERGFDAAQVVILSPPDLKGVHVRKQYEDFKGRLKWGTNAEAIAWQFMVTGDGAKSMDSTTIASTKTVRHRQVPEGRWTASGWAGHVGRYSCGGEDFDPSGAEGPLIAVVSNCTRAGT
jgi:hypothetical protein